MTIRFRACDISCVVLADALMSLCTVIVLFSITRQQTFGKTIKQFLGGDSITTFPTLTVSSTDHVMVSSRPVMREMVVNHVPFHGSYGD